MATLSSLLSSTYAGTPGATGSWQQVRVSSTTSASSVTPNITNYDEYAFTALAATLTINTPSGSPADGNKLLFRITDNGSAQTLSWQGATGATGSYLPIGTTLPTVTTANKTVYVGCIYNAALYRWEVVSVAQQS